MSTIFRFDTEGGEIDDPLGIVMQSQPNPILAFTSVEGLPFSTFLKRNIYARLAPVEAYVQAVCACAVLPLAQTIQNQAKANKQKNQTGSHIPSGYGFGG
jgi:hypothetical protein